MHPQNPVLIGHLANHRGIRCWAKTVVDSPSHTFLHAVPFTAASFMDSNFVSQPPVSHPLPSIHPSILPPPPFGKEEAGLLMLKPPRIPIPLRCWIMWEIPRSRECHARKTAQGSMYAKPDATQPPQPPLSASISTHRTLAACGCCCCCCCIAPCPLLRASCH
ncbi:hypothetical protein LY76DRAFT_263706 [Colletotrichum caudatum]|nr:hypothetical protein LY76DRAFT_263706 [Colletotrichum caudatum]